LRLMPGRVKNECWSSLDDESHWRLWRFFSDDSWRNEPHIS
jgi:hypothetical protein